MNAMLSEPCGSDKGRDLKFVRYDNSTYGKHSTGADGKFYVSLVRSTYLLRNVSTVQLVWIRISQRMLLGVRADGFPKSGVELSIFHTYMYISEYSNTNSTFRVTKLILTK